MTKTKEDLMEIEVNKLMSKPTEVKAKKRTYTKRAKDIKPEWVLLKQGGNKEMIDKLMRVYRDNPYHAYVLNRNNVEGFRESRTLLFKYSEKHFEVVQFEKKFGMSKTHRIYSRNKKIFSIIYKDNKLWHYVVGVKGSKTIKPLTINRLKELLCEIGGKSFYGMKHSEYISKLKDTTLYDFFDTKFFWFKTLMEYQFGGSLTINTIISKKLFGFDKLNRHIFQMNKAATTRLIESEVLYLSIETNFFRDEKTQKKGVVDKNTLSDIFYKWKYIFKLFDDIEHFDFKIVKEDETLFWDTLKMAEKLNKKISGRWSFKKLTAMHDLWSVEIQNILLDCEIERELKIVKVFEDFAKFSGYKLMKTNRELLKEGMRQNHCVGTYIEKVDNGECAIYDVNDYTLQLTVLEFKEINVNSNYINCYNAVLKDADIHKKRLRSNYNITSTPEHDKLIKHGIWLHNNQFKGRFNKSAPNELYKEVEKKLLEFSLNYDFGAIYENPTQAELEFKKSIDDKIANAFEDELLPFQ
jgi:hypothetical protein